MQSRLQTISRDGVYHSIVIGSITNLNDHVVQKFLVARNTWFKADLEACSNIRF